jgi:hypothetical protein
LFLVATFFHLGTIFALETVKIRIQPFPVGCQSNPERC